MTATRKTADNKPIEFDLDAVLREVDLAPFRFQWHGKRWEFKHIEELNAWDIAAASDAGNVKASEKLLELAIGNQAKWAEFRRISLPQGGLKRLMDAYLKHCGLEPGELLGSTDS